MHVPWIMVGASPIKEAILEDWLRLLADTTQPEESYQRFIHEHAAFCLSTQSSREELVFSKLRLGADYTIDFGVASSQRSYGFVFTLIEIETPHQPAFTSTGNPGVRLTRAIQQIRNWRAWLAHNPAEANRLFPSHHHRATGERHFKFIVIIGRRDDTSAKFTNKRNQMADESGTVIRSFDWITDNIKAFNGDSFTAYSTDLPGTTIDEDNKFSNPFYHAYSDPEWRAFVDDPTLKLTHMVGHNIALLQRLRRYNESRLKRFLAYLQTLPLENRRPPDFEYEARRIISH